MLIVVDSFVCFSTNHNHYHDLGSVASSVWNFGAHISDGSLGNSQPNPVAIYSSYPT